MGQGSLNSDKNVQLLVELQKRVYYAGEEVQGVVHLQVQAQTYYRQLDLVVVTREYVSWDKVTRHHGYYGNNNHNYDHHEIQYQESTPYQA
jgi:hypothetical protein